MILKMANVRKHAEIRNDQELAIWGSLEQRRGKLSLTFGKKNLNEGKRAEKDDIPMIEWTRREY